VASANLAPRNKQSLRAQGLHTKFHGGGEHCVQQQSSTWQPALKLVSLLVKQVGSVGRMKCFQRCLQAEVCS